MSLKETKKEEYLKKVKIGSIVRFVSSDGGYGYFRIKDKNPWNLILERIDEEDLKTPIHEWFSESKAISYCIACCDFRGEIIKL